jgi:hypothetical protein
LTRQALAPRSLISAQEIPKGGQQAWALAGVGGAVNPNLQQLFNQAHAYEQGALQLVSDTCFPRPSVFPTAIGGAHLGMSENVREQVTRTLREFDLEPREQVRTYQKPYMEFFDTVPYPRGV